MQILLVGDSGVGKSSLLMRFTADQFEESSVPTIGKAYTHATSGKTIMRSTHLTSVL